MAIHFAIYIQYATALSTYLRIWQLRMSGGDFRKFKNLQVSICAGLEEEIRIRILGTARRSAGKNMAECTAPLKNKNPPKHPPRPHQAPRDRLPLHRGLWFN